MFHEAFSIRAAASLCGTFLPPVTPASAPPGWGRFFNARELQRSVEGYMEIDATKTPVEARGIFVIAKSQSEAEVRLQALLQDAEGRAELGLRLPPVNRDRLYPQETCSALPLSLLQSKL
jgi:hypothetical protein